MVEALSTTFSNEFFGQYHWFCSNLLPSLQSGSDEFLLNGLQFKLAAISKNINPLFQEDSYFVTKVKVDASNEIYIRCSDKAVKVILEKAFGKSEKPFVINQITELEAKLITSYNDFIYNSIKGFINPYPAQSKKEFDITHLTFFVKNMKEKSGGKFILSMPSYLLSPVSVQSSGVKFTEEDFNKCFVEVDIKLGSTIFSVMDLKNLESEDIVVLEKSNIQSMQLDYMGYIKDFRIAPNPSLIISVDDSGGDDMDENNVPENLWDSIQVEMGAEFDKVKIPLGELKNIEQGLVVDISSVYNNKITLRVEEKIIAIGELVIVNDRYGVKINQVFASPKVSQVPAQVPLQEEQVIENINTEVENEFEENAVHEISENEEDFDYSDFELDDEDI